MTIFTKIKIGVAALVAILLCGWALYTVHMKSDRDRWMLEASVQREAAQEAVAALARDRAAWKVATLAFTTASQSQGAACRDDLERRALIDDISREATATPRPGGSIDEQTSGKVIDMFNGSLFAPLGGRVRTEAD